MDSQYSEENSMESHTEDDNSTTTEERDENSSEETALRQKSVMKTVVKKNKAASQLKTVLKGKSIPGVNWSTTRRPRSGIITMTSCKRFSWRVTTKVKQNRKPLKKFYLFSKRNWAMSTWITWHGWKRWKKIPSTKRSWRPDIDYVNNNMFDPDEAIAAAVKQL